MSLVIPLLVDVDGKRHSFQILVRGVEVPDPGAVTVDVREDPGHVWTPLTLIGGAEVEIHE